MLSTDSATPIRLPLRAGKALLHEEGACLPLRSRHGQCSACERACGVAALAVTIDTIILSDACTGCGRCTAACPTQALWLSELAGLDVAPAATAVRDAAATPAPLRIECRMVDPARLAPGTRIVPCLGALSVGHLLQHAAAGVEVQLIDRGWCAGCPAACGPPPRDDDGAAVAPAAEAHAARQALDAATAWLDAVGAVHRPSLRREPLPLAQRPERLPAGEPLAEPVDRRRFFREALQRPAGRSRTAAGTMGGDGRAAYPAERRQPSPERQRQLSALTRLAEAAGTEVPGEFFARLHVDASCCDRRLCVGICPTAALGVADDGHRARLQWSAERCIACGACMRACPNSALTLTIHGGAPGLQTLATHARRRCADCGDVFTPPAAGGGEPDPDAQLCPTCTKSRRFIDDARRQLFGALN